jgi:hypothetical protein
MGGDHYDLSAYPLFRSVIGAAAGAKAKRCFVIDPSDDVSGDVRKHADTLWKYVIQPALLDTDYGPHRTENTGACVAIDQQAIDAVLDDELVIAVLSYSNPRVFYETALAQAAARPLVLMIEEGQELDFDPRKAKVVTYRLDTESVVSAVNVTRLQSVIREIEESGGPACHGFRPGTSALNGGCENTVTVFERSPKFSYDRRLDMIREADIRIDIMGVANRALALHPDTAEVVRSRGGGRVEIRILQCAPSNPGLVSMLGAPNGSELDSVRNEIEAAADAWRRIVDAPKLDLSVTVRRAQTSLPMASALITDKAVVATPYLRSRPTTESPTIYAKAGDAYHSAMSEEFNLLWSEANTLFRVEPGIAANHSRSNGHGANGASYWPQPAAPVPTPTPTPAEEPAHANGTHANDASHNGHRKPTPESEHTRASNDEAASHASAHYALFAKPLASGGATTHGAATNGHSHRPKPAPTTNERGHAIIRSVG